MPEIGACRGFAKAVGQAFLEGHIKTCNELIAYIQEVLIFSDLEKTKARLQRRDRSIVTDEDRKVVAALDLFDQIALHQTYSMKSQLFQGSEAASQQGMELTTQDLPTIETDEEFTHLIRCCYKMIHLSETSLVIELGADSTHKSFSGAHVLEGHSFSICYDHLSKSWTLIDINQCPIKENITALEEIIHFITEACRIAFTHTKPTLFLSKISMIHHNQRRLNPLVQAIQYEFKRTALAESTTGLGFYQKQALEKLKKEGLTPAHLRLWDEGPSPFLSPHSNALSYLIRDCGFLPKDAISEISGLGYCQAETIFRSGERPNGTKILKRLPSASSALLDWKTSGNGIHDEALSVVLMGSSPS